MPPGQPVNVNLKDKREEDYEAPLAPAYVADSGRWVVEKTEENEAVRTSCWSLWVGGWVG